MFDNVFSLKFEEAAEETRSEAVTQMYTLVNSGGSALEHVIGMGVEQAITACRSVEGWKHPETALGLPHSDVTEGHVFGATAASVRDQKGALKHVGDYFRQLPTVDGLCKLVSHGDGNHGSLAECLGMVSQFAAMSAVGKAGRHQCVRDWGQSRSARTMHVVGR